MRISGHDFDDRVVASTLLARAARKESGLLFADDSAIETPGGLFRLVQGEEGVTLSRGSQVARMTPGEVRETPPDPLYPSAFGICKHMEDDHADSFLTFLRWRGWDGPADSEVTMPWVDQAGFVLAVNSDFTWIPFPAPCPTPNDVRKAMILMLREIRNE